MVPPLTVLDRAFVNPAGSDIIRPLLQPLVDDPDQVGELLGRKKVQVSEQGFRSDRFPGYTTDRLEPLIEVSRKQGIRALLPGDRLGFLEHLAGHPFEDLDQAVSGLYLQPEAGVVLDKSLDRVRSEQGRCGGLRGFPWPWHGPLHPLSVKMAVLEDPAGSGKTDRFGGGSGTSDRRILTDLALAEDYFLVRIEISGQKHVKHKAFGRLWDPTKRAFKLCPRSPLPQFMESPGPPLEPALPTLQLIPDILVDLIDRTPEALQTSRVLRILEPSKEVAGRRWIGNPWRTDECLDGCAPLELSDVFDASPPHVEVQGLRQNMVRLVVGVVELQDLDSPVDELRHAEEPEEVAHQPQSASQNLCIAGLRCFMSG